MLYTDHLGISGQFEQVRRWKQLQNEDFPTFRQNGGALGE